MDLKFDSGIIVLLTSSFISGFQAEVVGERNATRANFLENTRYCDCPPLSEFDEDGNHKWEIDMTLHNIDLCKAKYSCREGYQSQDEHSDITRTCFLQTNWNHTEPECRKIEQNDEYSAVLYIVVPSALLAVVFIVMILFVRWWQRRSKHKSGESKLGDIEEEARVNTFYIKDQIDGRELNDKAHVVEEAGYTTHPVDKL